MLHKHVHVSLRAALLAATAVLMPPPLGGQDRPPQHKLRVDPPNISADKEIKYDYDIVYVRAPRTMKRADGKEQQAMVWPEASMPHALLAATDLMVLHPDGTQDVLVEGG